ncbi:MAG: TIGR04283 family arsenosugar biosynthesis glycosyltransferase [Pirellulaceae bacterium]
MRLSIIIPALNEAANIGLAVESACQAGASEVLVVDGGSSDGTRAIARQRSCTLIASSRGRAVQQNAGARAATGDVLLFLHADCRLATRDVASQVRAALRNPRRRHGALRQRIDAAELSYRLIERGNAARVRCLGLPYGDQAIFIRAETFWSLGGFPEVPLLEDLNLMQQLRRQAWPALIAGPVVVSPRRWQQHGPWNQTLRNAWLIARHALGASPASLARHYRPHDEEQDAAAQPADGSSSNDEPSVLTNRHPAE